MSTVITKNIPRHSQMSLGTEKAVRSSFEKAVKDSSVSRAKDDKCQDSRLRKKRGLFLYSL